LSILTKIKNSNDQQRGVLLAIVATILASGFMIPWKISTEHGSVPLMVLTLVLAAAIFNSAAVVKQHGIAKLWAKPNKVELTLGLVMAVFTLIGNFASAQAVSYLSPALVATLMRAEVIIVAIMAWIAMGEKIGHRFWLGVIIVIIGFLIMQPTVDTGGDWLRGSLFALIAAAAFGVMAVLTRKYIHSIDSITLNAHRLWFSVILWFPVHQEIPEFSQLNGTMIFYTSLAAILGPGLARLTYMNSAKYIEAKTGALVVSSGPVFTLIFAMIILSEIPTQKEIWGGLILLGGIAYTLSHELKPTPSPSGLKN